MLQNFFRLNGQFTLVESQGKFLSLLKVSDSLKNLLYQPDEFAPARPLNRLKGNIFTNVSFAKTTLIGIEFSNCRFVDCLFIGTVFQQCEFHGCEFDGCNLYKARFEGTYVNPEVFAKLLNKKRHSNIGVYLFQQLMRNAANMRQFSFAQKAEYYFLRWKRYQLNYDRSRKTIGLGTYIWRWLWDWLYDWTSGYGLRDGRFVRSTVLMLLMVVAVNYTFWDTFGMYGIEGPIESTNTVTVFYYTISTITTLGFGDITPTSSVGMGVAAGEALFGILWLAALASMIIKKVIR